MTIQIDVKPELLERLVAEARARGITLEEYAETLLRDSVEGHAAFQGKLSVEELRTMMRAVAEGSEKLPSLPTSAFTRESFYEPHR